MVAVASTATTNSTGLLKNWERIERRNENNNITGVLLLLSFSVRRSLSHLASCNLMTLSVWENAHFYQATLRPGLQISNVTPPKKGKITGDLVALRIMLPPICLLLFTFQCSQVAAHEFCTCFVMQSAAEDAYSILPDNRTLINFCNHVKLLKYLRKILQSWY